MSEPLVDAHLHLWDPTRLRYAWLDGNPLLDRRYGAPEFAAASMECAVERAVFVQCDCRPEQSLDEVRWVASLAAEGLPVQGIVARAPVELGADVRPHLAELARIPLVRGIRRIIQGEPAAGFCQQPAFIAGVQALAEFGFSFDLCVRRDQMADAVALVGACPQVRFVLDHCGGPDIRGRTLEPWRTQLEALGRLPNAWCKLSGLPTLADEKAWKTEDLAPYVDHVITAFGTGRVLFGGDWPVVLKAGAYRRWVDAAHQLLAELPAADRRRVLHDNAIAFYRLPA
jgi:L-fuconolactonase